MSLTAGTLALQSVQATSATVSASAATSGSTPYTYQLYQSTVSNFIPTTSNAVSGATSLQTALTGLVAGTQYYYKQVVIDSAAASVTTAQLGVVTAPSQSQNQFLPTPIVGMADQRYNYNTTPAMIDVTETATIDYPGTFVKMVTSSTGIPKVVAITTTSDPVIGVIWYNPKDVGYTIGQPCELAQGGDVIYMISNAAISAGAQVQPDLSSYVGAVVTFASGTYVGYAMDATTGPGQLLRVKLVTPSFTT